MSQFNSKIFDVIVVGSGPAGSTAAYHLSKEGINTVLVEKEILPRYKTCGGGVVARISNIIPFNFSGTTQNICYRIEINDVEGNVSIIQERNFPVIFMVMRAEFDHFLLEKAKEKGTKIIQNCKVTNVFSDGVYSKLITDRGELKAKFIIAADGASGILAKKTGLRYYYKIIPALEYETYVDKSTFEKFNSARFDFGIIPNGYGWIFPKKEHLSIGIVSMKKNKINLKKSIENYLNFLEIKNYTKIDKHGYFINFGNYKNTCINGNILFTGDAAGFADPITGEGISYAILSGKLAANSIIQGNFNCEKIKNIYQNSVKKEIISELKYAEFLSKLIYGNKDIRIFIIKRYGLNLSNIMLDIISGKKTYKEMMTNPVNYLKLIKLRKNNQNIILKKPLIN